MPAFAEKYSDVQRAALASAFEDRKVRPARRVKELAEAGELTFDGETLPAFHTTETTVRYEASRLRRRRAGEVKSDLATAPPRDAIEVLRRRLINAADAMMTVFERAVQRAAKKGEVKPQTVELGRQIARLIFEAARLPGPTDARPAAPAARDSEGRQAPHAQGGMAGELLKAHNATSRAARHHQAPEPAEPPRNDERPAETGPSDDSPAAYVRRQLAQLDR